MVHRRLEELREPDKLAAWLGAIARNVARKHLRQHKLEQERFGRDREVVEALATTIRIDSMTGNLQENHKMRDVIGGMEGKINWHKLTNDDILASWRLAGNTAGATAWGKQGNAIIGDDGGRGDAPILVSDTNTWSDFELSLLLTPISGGNAQVAFRLSETGSSYYLFDMLLGWKAIAISRVIKGHLTKLSVVNFPVELGQEYEVQIAARGASFTSYIDGKLVNQVTDENIRSGAIALIVWEGKVAFRDFRFRHLH